MIFQFKAAFDHVIRPYGMRGYYYMFEGFALYLELRQGYHTAMYFVKIDGNYYAVFNDLLLPCEYIGVSDVS